MAAQYQRAEEFTTCDHGCDPVVAVPHRVALRAGRLQRPGRCDGGLRELDRAVEDLGDRRGHVVHPAAVQYELGEPVVHVRGAFDDSAAVPDDLVGPFQICEGRAGLGEQVRGVEGGCREGGEGAEQRDLLALEDPGAPVRREEDPDDMVAQRQRHPEDGDQPLVTHTGVDGEGVLEAVVLEVVVGDVRAGRLRDEAAQALPHAEPQLLEAGGDRALGHPHVGVAPGRVVQAEIRHVRAEQGPGALHDRLEHGVQVPQAGQVVGRLEQGRQLGLASAAPLQLGADAQREQLGLFEGDDPFGGSALGTGEQHRLLISVGGRAPGQQLKERCLGAAQGRSGGGR